MDALFDAAALTHFWEDAAAMSLTAHTHKQLVLEGIEFPVDLDEFDEKGLEKIFKNLANPAKVARGGAGANARLCEVIAYTMSGKSKMRIEGAMKMAKFYKTIGRPLDLDNMSWPLIKNSLSNMLLLRKGN